MAPDTLVIVTARNEAPCIQATLTALADAFPDAVVWVADDGSYDGTGELARGAGARVVAGPGHAGKGAAATLAARELLGWLDCADARHDITVVLCDGDLGESAARLAQLAEAVSGDRADIAVAVFSRRVGGGFGIALRFARWAIRRRCGLRARAPISGQRALRAETLARLLPFASGFGMELGMTIDAVRAGLRVVEVELDLSHRATGRTPAGFVHRARQLLDMASAYHARR